MGISKRKLLSAIPTGSEQEKSDGVSGHHFGILKGGCDGPNGEVDHTQQKSEE